MNDKEKPYIPIYEKDKIELNYFNYNSPIQIIQDIQNNIRENFDNKIYNAVIKYDIHVDKQELIKALEYDRNQYEQGFKDAKKRYEKALDKACDYLERVNSQDCNIFDEYDDIPDIAYSFDKKQWKEWAKKDE